MNKVNGHSGLYKDPTTNIFINKNKVEIDRARKYKKLRLQKKEEERERDLEQQRMIHPNNHNNSYSAAIYAENNYLVEQRKANSDSFATSSVRSSSRSTSRRPHDSDKG